MNDVALTNLGSGIGLWLDVHSDNSGPYTNIRYSGGGTCARIYSSGGSSGLINTRGIRGLTCTMVGSSLPAVFLDAPNNSLEDVAITYVPSNNPGGPPDGIVIGSQAPAYNNVIFNLSGTGLNDVVHICSSTLSGSCPGGTAHNVNDLTVLGVTNSGGGTGNVIADDVTSTILPDGHLGMYVLGEPVKAASNPVGYSRFTTSTSLPAWLVGTGAPAGSTCKFGALYSTTSGGGSSSIYGCTGATINGPWTAIH